MYQLINNHSCIKVVCNISRQFDGSVAVALRYYFCFGFIYSFITRLRNYIHYVSQSSDYNMTNTFRVKQQRNTRHEGNVGYIVLFIKVNNNNKNT